MMKAANLHRQMTPRQDGAETDYFFFRLFVVFGLSARATCLV